MNSTITMIVSTSAPLAQETGMAIWENHTLRRVGPSKYQIKTTINSEGMSEADVESQARKHLCDLLIEQQPDIVSLVDVTKSKHIATSVERKARAAADLQATWDDKTRAEVARNSVGTDAAAELTAAGFPAAGLQDGVVMDAAVALRLLAAWA